MVNEKLIQYIQSYVNQGYDVQVIRNSLVQNGWQANDVDEAIRFLYRQNLNTNLATNQNIQNGTEIKHTIDFSKNLIFFVGIVFSIIIGVILFKVILGDDVPGQLLDYKLKITSKTVEPGGEISFINDLTNQGSNSRYDIFLEYKVISLDTNKVIETWKESKAITTVQEYTVTHLIPEDAGDGKYALDVEVTYNGDKSHATASDTFTIKTSEPSSSSSTSSTSSSGTSGGSNSGSSSGTSGSSTGSTSGGVEATCGDGKRNQGETGVDCGGPCKKCDLCADGIRNQGEYGIDCGGPCEAKCDFQCDDCNDDDVCTEDLCIDGECLYKKLKVCCGDGICDTSEVGVCETDCKQKEQFLSSSEINQHVSELVYEDLNSAGDYCASIFDSTKKDYCYRIVAHTSGNKNFCSFIESESNADFCYIKFSQLGDMSVCEKIKNVHLKQACDTLKNSQGG